MPVEPPSAENADGHVGREHIGLPEVIQFMQRTSRGTVRHIRQVVTANRDDQCGEGCISTKAPNPKSRIHNCFFAFESPVWYRSHIYFARMKSMSSYAWTGWLKPFMSRWAAGRT